LAGTKAIRATAVTHLTAGGERIDARTKLALKRR
jgi:hypothetical protein